MSSTKDDKSREVVDALFDTILVPMAEGAWENGEAPFQRKPNAARESYYVRRAKSAMTHSDFSAPSCTDFDDFERASANRDGDPADAQLPSREIDLHLTGFVNVL